MIVKERVSFLNTYKQAVISCGMRSQPVFYFCVDYPFLNESLNFVKKVVCDTMVNKKAIVKISVIGVLMNPDRKSPPPSDPI